MALSLALTAAQDGRGVRQYPSTLSVMRGEAAPLQYGVQWIQMCQAGCPLVVPLSPLLLTQT